MNQPHATWADNCDDLYLKHREEEGRPGWTTAAQLDTDLGLIDAFLQQTELPTTGRGLELGAGAGNIALHLAGLGFDMTGVELSAEAVNWAKENARQAGFGVPFFQGDVCDVQAARAGAWGSGYDLVVDGHCLHWLAGDDRTRFLEVARTLLAPDGRFWVRAMCGDPPAAWLAGGGTWQKGDVTMRWDADRHSVMTGEVVVCCILPPEVILAQVAEACFEVLQRHVWPPADENDAAELFCLARIAPGV